jgi:hypothetical protein
MCPSYLRALLTKLPSGGKSTTCIRKFQYETVQVLLGECTAKSPGLSGLRRLELFGKIRGGIGRAQVGAHMRYSITPEGVEFDTLEASRAGSWTSKLRRR